MSLNDKSEKMIDTKLLNTMRKNSIIINTSRGKILKDDDIYKILKKTKYSLLHSMFLKLNLCL